MNKKHIKLVATDCDGTLFSTFGVLSAFAKETLRKLRQAGIIVVISSGRPYYSIERSIPKDCFDYASCMNGQEIVSLKDNKHIIKPDLNKEQIQELLSFMPKYRMMLSYSSKDQFYSYIDPSHKIYQKLYDFAYALVHWIRHEKFYRNEINMDINKCHFENCGKFCFAAPVFTLRKFYKELDITKFSCFFVNSHWLEVQGPGISKGIALQDILKLEHLTKEDACAIGDGENDIPMFDVVGTPVAMANAMKAVKKKAIAVADYYSNDGCAKWLNDNLLK